MDFVLVRAFYKSYCYSYGGVLIPFQHCCTHQWVYNQICYITSAVPYPWLPSLQQIKTAL